MVIARHLSFAFQTNLLSLVHFSNRNLFSLQFCGKTLHSRFSSRNFNFDARDGFGGRFIRSIRGIRVVRTGRVLIGRDVVILKGFGFFGSLLGFGGFGSLLGFGALDGFGVLGDFGGFVVFTRMGRNVFAGVLDILGGLLDRGSLKEYSSTIQIE